MRAVIDTHPDGLLLSILCYTGLSRGEALCHLCSEPAVSYAHRNQASPFRRQHSCAICASIFYRSGMDVLSAQRYPGHTGRAIIQRLHTHLSNEMQLKDAEKNRKAFR